MDEQFLRQNWGPAVAAVLLAMVLVVVVMALYRRSATGQLRQRVKTLRRARNGAAKAASRLSAAQEQLERLRARAAKVKPRIVDEAAGALEDARALQKIADDRVLVEANHLRRIIYQEFPPARHDTLRRRHLPDDKPDSRPFSF